MTRREVFEKLIITSATAVGAGCGTKRVSPAVARRSPPLRFAPVYVSADRITRTTVGLRPFRPSGFVLKAEKLDPSDTAVLRNLMTISFNMHKWDDAIQYAQKVSSNPSSAYIIGRSQYELENYGEAVKQLTLAEKVDPRNAEIHYYLARSYMDQSNYKQSAAAFERAITIDTTHAQWVYETSLAFYAVPDYNKSLQYMLLAGTRGLPRSNDYLENLANVFVRTNQHPEAIKLFKEVLIKKPTDQEIIYQLAQSYYLTKQYDDAIINWNKILTNDSSNAQAMYMMGLSYQKKGDMTKGTQLCEQAIKIDPSLKNYRQEKQQAF